MMTRQRVLSIALVALACVSSRSAAAPGQGYFGIDWKPEPVNATELGMRVVAVSVGGPAQRAGVVAGDLLLSIDGRGPSPVMSEAEHQRFWAGFHAGNRVEVMLLRGGQKLTVRFELGDLPPDVAEEQRRWVAAEQCKANARAGQERAAAARPAGLGQWGATAGWKGVLRRVKNEPVAVAVVKVIGGKTPQSVLEFPDGRHETIRLEYLPPFLLDEGKALKSGQQVSYRISVGEGLSFRLHPLTP